jgi:hypothetical protein
VLDPKERRAWASQIQGLLPDGGLLGVAFFSHCLAEETLGHLLVHYGQGATAVHFWPDGATGFQRVEARLDAPFLRWHLERLHQG